MLPLEYIGLYSIKTAIVIVVDFYQHLRTDRLLHLKESGQLLVPQTVPTI